MADLITLIMISWFRERPLLLFGAWACGAALLALVFGVAAAAAFATPPDLDAAFVLPGITLLWLMLAAYLMMLGLIAEVALRRARQHDSELLPIVSERRR